MRLTLDIIRRAPQFTNTLLEREIDLRGLGLTVLDEQLLLMLNDSFDVLNLSQNPLVRLDYFPSGRGVSTAAVAGATGYVDPAKRMMLRLKSLIVHRNRLSHVSEATCAAVLPNVRAFLADHNEFRELRDLLFLSHWRKLEILSIEHNPVTLRESEVRLRAFVVFLCPTLKLVNYQRVTQDDRRNVETMRTEFEGLVKEWRHLGAQSRGGRSGDGDSNGDKTGINGGGVANGQRPRKRGREARAAAAAAANKLSGGDGLDELASTAGGPSTTTTAGVAAPDTTHEVVDSTQARLEALEVKMAAAETEEELLEIQQEIMELEAAAKQQQQQKGAKSKRARTS